MFDSIVSSGTILTPEFTQALQGFFVSLFQVIALGLMTLAGLGLKMWITKMKSGLQRTIATRLVSYAEQKFVDNADRQKFVADSLSKKFPRLPSEEIQIILEAAVVELKKARGALMILLALGIGLFASARPAIAADIEWKLFDGLTLTLPFQDVQAAYLYDLVKYESLVGAETPFARIATKITANVGAVTSLSGQGAPFVSANYDLMIAPSPIWTIGPWICHDFADADLKHRLISRFGIKASVAFWGGNL